MTTETIILALTPILVLLVTKLVTWLTGKIDGKIVITIVPILSLVASWVTSLVTPEIPFWLQVGYGLIAVFLFEFIRRWGSALKKE